MTRYREIKPGADAGRFVRAYWVLEDDDPSCVHRIVPDGRAELIVNLGKPYQTLKNEVWTPQAECFLIG